MRGPRHGSIHGRIGGAGSHRCRHQGLGWNGTQLASEDGLRAGPRDAVASDAVHPALDHPGHARVRMDLASVSRQDKLAFWRSRDPSGRAQVFGLDAVACRSSPSSPVHLVGAVLHPIGGITRRRGSLFAGVDASALRLQGFQHQVADGSHAPQLQLATLYSGQSASPSSFLFLEGMT